MTTIARDRVTLDENTALWLKAYTETRDEIKRLEEVAAQARSHVEEALGESEEGVLDGQVVVRWTYVASTRVDLKKLRENHAELVESFTVPTNSRRFTVSEDEPK